MKFGTKHRFGEIILAEVQYTDTFEVKKRPALVLFQEYGNIVVAGITSNLEMKGILIKKEEGLPKDSIIKLNYLFTISERAVERVIAILSEQKKRKIKEEFIKKIQ
jgi:mRNA interferase MazF